MPSQSFKISFAMTGHGRGNIEHDGTQNSPRLPAQILSERRFENWYHEFLGIYFDDLANPGTSNGRRYVDGGRYAPIRRNDVVPNQLVLGCDLIVAGRTDLVHPRQLERRRKTVRETLDPVLQ